MLKHGRFMQNLQVKPVYPRIEEVANEDDEDNANNSDDE
jgi:hypothetical protein